MNNAKKKSSTKIDVALLKERIEKYREKLCETPSISETRYKNMAAALSGVNMIIDDIVKSEFNKIVQA